MDISQESLALHYKLRGKLEVVSRYPIQTQKDLSLAYTPGVAAPCLEIQKDPAQSFQLTRPPSCCWTWGTGTSPCATRTASWSPAPRGSPATMRSWPPGPIRKGAPAPWPTPWWGPMCSSGSPAPGW